MNYLSYEEIQGYLIDYWWFNPQKIGNFEIKYFELAAQNSRLPTDPISFFRSDTSFFAFSTLFGEEFFTFEEAMEYCCRAYLKLNRHVNLQDFYKSLRSIEARLPSAPYVSYKDSWKNWAEFFNTKQLVAVPDYYSLSELRTYCINMYKEQIKRPVNLQKFFHSFKHEDKKIPKNPFTFYRKTGEWVSWKDLFGLKRDEWASFQIAQEFCIKKYQEEPDKPNNFAIYYLFLRETYHQEIRLPRHPEAFYAKTNEWQSFKSLFGLF